MAFCIPKQLAETMKAAARRGEIKIASLIDMTSEQRRSFFEFYTDLETAKGINAGFERAMASEYKNSYKVWVKNTFNAKEKKVAKNLIDKINDLSSDKLLDPESRDGFMQDLIAEKLGATVTEEEAKKINELSEGLQAEYDKGPDEYGILPVSYWQSRLKMDQYLQQINPASQVRIATSTIGRAAMLASFKSPLLNISGNTIQGFEQAFERRIENTEFSGKVDKKVLKGYVKKVNDIFSKSNYDVTRMQDLSDGRKTLGEEITHAQGKGGVRLVGRLAENIIFKQLLGKPDVLFSSYSFADSANLSATRIAKQEGLKGGALSKRATELFKDATSLSPTSINGRVIRSHAISDAQIATFTDDNTLSKASMAVRKVLNDVTGDLRVGDQIMPFVKTPASVVSITLDASGLSAVRGIRKLPRAISEMKAGDGSLMRSVAREFSRSGFGMTIAFIIASAFDKDDFIGAYPATQKERELLRTKNARANSIKMGDKWVSLEYFGFLGSSMTGFLYARKYKDNLHEAMFNYAAGAFTQAQELPFIDPVKDVISFIQDISPDGKIDMNDLPDLIANSATDYIRARTIPAIFYDLAKGFDTAEREVDYKNPLEKVKSTIPGLRQTLPEKVDVFGDVIQGEPFYSSILFGARVKTARDNKIVDELKRLQSTGNLPTLTRPERTSTRVKAFKNQVSESKFDKTINDFRTRYKQDTARMIDSGRYKRMNDEEKKKALDKIKNDSLDRALKINGYRSK